MIVLLNRAAAGGAAGRRWERVRPALERGELRRGYALVTDPAALDATLAGDRDRVLVAAGGDGTVNLALEHLLAMAPGDRAAWRLGAIGLGSSNDFHKPAGARRAAVPLRLDLASTRRLDVGRIDFLDERGVPSRRHFLLNASVGVVAEANALFNDGDAVLRLLKPLSISCAIAWAALRALLAAPDLPARVDGAPLLLANAHLLLSPHFTGSLRYDLDVRPGTFTVALSVARGRCARVGTLAGLCTGRFRGLPGARSFAARSLALDFGAPVALETDGEVRLASRLRASLVPEGVVACC